MLPRTTAAAAVLKKKKKRNINIWPKLNDALLPQSPGTSSDNLLATTAFPDTNGSAADSITTAEAASVLGVLSGFNLLHLLTDGSTVTSTVLTDNSNFLGALRLQRLTERTGLKGVDS